MDGQTSMGVRGLGCSGCQRKLEAAIGGLPGVHGVEVDLLPGQVSTLRLRHEPGLDAGAVAAAVTTAGFTPVLDGS